MLDRRRSEPTAPNRHTHRLLISYLRAKLQADCCRLSRTLTTNARTVTERLAVSKLSILPRRPIMERQADTGNVRRPVDVGWRVSGSVGVGGGADQGASGDERPRPRPAILGEEAMALLVDAFTSEQSSSLCVARSAVILSSAMGR